MGIWSYFLPKSPKILVYMLQQVEYNSSKFLKWTITLPNLLKVQKRQKLETTARVQLLLAITYSGWIFLLVTAVVVCLKINVLFGVLLLFLLPLFLICVLATSNTLLDLAIITPKEKREIARAKNKLMSLPATRIAILGSYGKTTTKEILTAVLSSGKQVVATPGNKNVLISHARWVNSLNGAEDVLIFEYGEGKPGDIKLLTDFSHPEIAVITGVAAAHMEEYGSLDAIAKDFRHIFSVCSPKNVFINGDSPELTSRIHQGRTYFGAGLGDWKIKLQSQDLDGMDFIMSSGKKTLKLHTKLIGEHLLGSLGLAVELAEQLGLSDQQIKAGVAATKPFEHRMQPYKLAGAQIIDDTYNGNIEGVRAGLKLLGELKTTGRKIYVTPGLVEQGALTRVIHNKLGQLIAKSQPDRVVLMQNSVTSFIQDGLDEGGFAGELLIEPVPLDFYTNLEHFVAAGDIVLMQNDWPDSYR